MKELAPGMFIFGFVLAVMVYRQYKIFRRYRAQRKIKRAFKKIEE